MRSSFLRISIFILLVIFFGQCENKELVPVTTFDCSQSTLTISLVSKQDASACNLIDGKLTVIGENGNGSYAYNINAGEYQTDPTFTNLGPGLYTVRVKDSTSCWKSIQVDISYPSNTLVVDVAITADDQCLTNNGSISVTPTGGNPPYMFQFGTGSFETVSSFNALKSGSYTITVQDKDKCPKAINVIVPRGDTHVSFDVDIKPIMTTKCAISGCHNGDNGASRNWNDLANVQKNAANIKLRTGNKSMPITDALTPDQIALIACWVDDGAKTN
jgi:SprB repeat